MHKKNLSGGTETMLNKTPFKANKIRPEQNQYKSTALTVGQTQLNSQTFTNHQRKLYQKDPISPNSDFELSQQ